MNRRIVQNDGYGAKWPKILKNEIASEGDDGGLVAETGKAFGSIVFLRRMTNLTDLIIPGN